MVIDQLSGDVEVDEAFLGGYAST